jgi:hypothetical protein
MRTRETGDRATDQDVGLKRGAILVAIHLELHGQAIGSLDTPIAAHARSLGATVMTHNVREFSRAPEGNVEMAAVAMAKLFTAPWLTSTKRMMLHAGIGPRRSPTRATSCPATVIDRTLWRAPDCRRPGAPMHRGPAVQAGDRGTACRYASAPEVLVLRSHR